MDTADADSCAGIVGVDDLAVAHVHGVVARIVDDVSCLCFIEKGPDKAMTQFNTRK